MMLSTIACKVFKLGALCAFLLIVPTVISGCAGSTIADSGHEPTLEHTFYLVAHEWHAGIVVRKDDIPKSIWLQSRDFQNADYLEVGWGDGDFYQAREIRAGLAVKALFLPTPAVLHVVGFSGSVTDYFPHSDILEFQVNREGLDDLFGFIEKGYAKDKHGRPMPLGLGLYGDSRFYASSQNYHLFRTCNVWSGGALKAAGLPVSSWFAFTVEELMNRAAQYGTLIQSAAKTE